MNTYRELVYMVLDELKLTSDDSMWETDHIVFLLNKFRALLIKQRYANVKKVIPAPYFQQLNVVISASAPKSIKTLPSMVELNGNELFFTAATSSEDVSRRLVLVSAARFPYVQINKWMNKVVYCSLGNDNYLYIKCLQDKPTTVILNVILEKPQDKLAFTAATTNPLDIDFPIETSALNDIISLVVRELAESKVIPDVEKNNAAEENVQPQRPSRNA